MKTTLTLDITHIDKDDEKTWPPMRTWILCWKNEYSAHNPGNVFEYKFSATEHWKAFVGDFHAWALSPSIPTPSEKKEGG